MLMGVDTWYRTSIYLPQVAEINTPLRMDADGECSL